MKALRRLGFASHHQTGSQRGSDGRIVVVPMHKPINAARCAGCSGRLV